LNATETLGSAHLSAGESAGLGAVDALLRDRAQIRARITQGDDLVGLSRTFVLTIAAACAVMGAVIGSYRGGVQVAYAGLKLPLVVLLTAGVTTPAYSALRAALRGHTDVRRDAATVLAALALTSLLIAATAPFVLLAVTVGVGYHDLVLLIVACCGLGGLAGLVFFADAQRDSSVGDRRLVGLVTMLVFALAGSQLSWSLRPYLVRPRTEEVPLVRSLEGSFLDAVGRSFDSARGVYARDYAPLPEPRR
jgi:hypothetical protein